MTHKYERHDWQALMETTLALALRESFTVYSLAEYLGVDARVAGRTVRRLRNLLADQEVNVVCRPQGKGEPWLYSLVGDLESVENWRGIRVRGLRSQLETVRNVASSLVNATPATDPNAMAVRFALLQVDHLLESLALLDQQQPPKAAAA